MTIWTIGGLDPSGGAGVLRDIWTIESLDPQQPVHALLSAWTWQGDGQPARAEAMDVRRLLELAQTLALPQVIKLGMVPAVMVDAIIEVFDGIATAQRSRKPVVVFDPVCRPSDGGDLGVDALALLPLLARADVLTPNLDEAQWLLQVGNFHRTGRTDIPISPEDSIMANNCSEQVGKTQDLVGNLALALAECFPRSAILVKGGHADVQSARELVVDVLRDQGRSYRFERSRQSEKKSPRGTGCALASAIACGLARGSDLYHAVALAIAWLDDIRHNTWPGPDGRPHLPIPSNSRIWGSPNPCE